MANHAVNHPLPATPVCVVCGPGCVSPIPDVRTSCPGPAAGVTAVSGR